MTPKSYLVYLGALGLLWLNGELHVNIDMTLSLVPRSLFFMRF